jgi:hypothetical protein
VQLRDTDGVDDEDLIDIDGPDDEDLMEQTGMFIQSSGSRSPQVAPTSCLREEKTYQIPKEWYEILGQVLQTLYGNW